MQVYTLVFKMHIGIEWVPRLKHLETIPMAEHFLQATGAASRESGFQAAASERLHQRRSAVLRAGAKAAAGGRASGRPDGLGVSFGRWACDSSSSLLPIPLRLSLTFVLLVVDDVVAVVVAAAPATAVFAENLCVASYVGLGSQVFLA